MQQIDIALNDDPVFRIRLRTLANQDQVRRAAQCIAAARDAASDGLFDPSNATELNFWTARVATCLEQGVALGVFVNDGDPVGGVCALFLPPGRQRAVVYACNSLIARDEIEPLMDAALRKLARDAGVSLLRHRYETTVLGPGDTVFGANNEVLTQAVKVVRGGLVDY